MAVWWRTGRGEADLEGDDLPLAGLRALEFGYGVAAPVCCRNLAQFGAEVIRIESVRRPDSLRIVGAGWVPPEVGWEVARDTGQALNFTCPGKRSIGLEVDVGEGREIFLRLVAASDLLVMNMSVEAVASLGLGYEEIKAVRPDVIWMNMPSFGSAGGPDQDRSHLGSKHIGDGRDIQAWWAGRTGTRWASGQLPGLCLGAVGDHRSGLRGDPEGRHG